MKRYSESPKLFVKCLTFSLFFFLIGGVYLLDVNQIAINLKAIFAKGSRYVFFF